MNLFKRKKPEPVVFIPQEPVTHIKQGSWAKAPDGRVGIVTDLGPQVEITLTAADGSTIMEIVDNQAVPATVVYPAESVVRASISDIPRNRYESVEQLKALGYGD